MLYRRKVEPVQAVELQWENWSEVCEVAGVGRLSEGRPEGCYLDEDGEPTEGPMIFLGLLIPSTGGLVVARQGQMIVKFNELTTSACDKDEFFNKYEPVEMVFVPPEPVNAFFG